MYSMTGYGRGDATNGSISVTIELRSVNHRFRDLNVKLPREYAALEPRVLALLRERFSRGRIDCAVRRTSPDGQLEVSVDTHLAETCYRAMMDIARRLQRDPKEIPVSAVFSQPGVLVVAERDIDVSHEWDLVEPSLLAAITHLQEMRAIEGATIRKDIQQHLGLFIRLRGEMTSQAVEVEDRLRRKLDDRLHRMLGEHIDPTRLIQEVAILADKADISEELSRLESHCDQVRDLLISSEPAGRKLEFLLQEMSREVNTIGSKAAGQNASAIVVEMKTVLEKIREQSANIE